MSELAGLLSERVVVERYVGAADGAGGVAGTWAAAASLWAAVAPEGEGTAARIRVTVRTPCELTIDDRLRWRELVLRVLRVERDPARAERVTILAEEMRA